MPNQQLWSTYNVQPKKSINQVITPKIIMKDQQACQAILQKIKNEKIAEVILQQFYIDARRESKDRLIRQHERNISLELKAGLKKVYENCDTTFMKSEMQTM